VSPIRVLIADDQAMVRGGFSMILAAEADIEVVGEAEDGGAAVAEAARLRPDLVVMDIQMPGLDGVAATRAILARVDPPPRVLVVTTFDVDEYVTEALRAGASGFLLKNAPPEELVRAIRVVAEGDALLSPSVTRRLLERLARHPAALPRPAALDELTDRETEILLLVARGLSNAEIAERLVVSIGTVKTHVARVLMKLGLRDRVQAVVLAYESGLVAPGQEE
jgi:DNA-binding NarL/FixJ family response regulator